jgi:hypothetical protein
MPTVSEVSAMLSESLTRLRLVINQIQGMRSSGVRLNSLDAVRMLDMLMRKLCANSRRDLWLICHHLLRIISASRDPAAASEFLLVVVTDTYGSAQPISNNEATTRAHVTNLFPLWRDNVAMQQRDPRWNLTSYGGLKVRLMM